MDQRRNWANTKGSGRIAAPCNLDPPQRIWPGAFDGAVVLDGEDVPGNDVPGDAGFVPKPVAPVPVPVAPPLISDSVEGTGGPVGVNGVLEFLEPVEPAAPAAPPAPGAMPGLDMPPPAAPPPTLPPGEAAIAGAKPIRAAKAEATINFLMLSPLSCCFDGKHALGLAVPGSMFMRHAYISIVRINRGSRPFQPSGCWLQLRGTICGRLA